MTGRLFLSGYVSGRPQAWPLDRPRIGVGRSRDNSIRLGDETVSREQAEIFARGDAWFLRDLGGKNVTRVNGAPAKGPVPLRVGDHINFGRVMLRVTDEEGLPSTRLSEPETISTSLRIPAVDVLTPGLAGGPSPPTVVRALATAGGLLVKESPLHETCDELLRVIDEVVPASRLILLVRPQPDSEPVQIAARRRGETISDPLLLSRGILGAVLESGSSVITTDAMTDSRFEGRGSVTALRTRSAMAVPLYENGRILGLLYADQDDPRIRYQRGDLEIMTLFGNMIAVKVTNDRLADANHNLIRIEHELAVASQIQRGLLPAEPPRIAGYECHAIVESCEEVGGDLYDFHRMPDGSLYFLLGDVSGKGIYASLLMTHFMAFAGALYEQCDEPADLATRLSALMARRIETGHFVTAFIGRLSPDTGLLRYANAGHPYPILVGKDSVQELHSLGPPCGIRPDVVQPGRTIQLAPGSLLAVFSDGIPEARRNEHEFFETSRLERLLVDQSRSRALGSVSQEILEEVDSFIAGGPRQDDIALLLLRRSHPVPGS